MNIASTAKVWVESHQNSTVYTTSGILTPPKETATPVWSKKVSEILPNWEIPGIKVYSYAARAAQNSRTEYLSRNTSCMW